MGTVCVWIAMKAKNVLARYVLNIVINAQMKHYAINAKVVIIWQMIQLLVSLIVP